MTQERSGATAIATPLTLSRSNLRRVEEWSLRSHPGEACGFLVGESSSDSTRVTRVAKARNLRNDSNHHYTIDPEDYLAIERSARDDGLEVVGFWHSHPDHPPIPSPTDLEAAWPGVAYLIVETTAVGSGEARVWWLVAGHFQTQPLDLEDS